ncbi:MAG: serine hydrolase domain-containing protein [Bacteroidota bacterium]
MNTNQAFKLTVPILFLIVEGCNDPRQNVQQGDTIFAQYDALFPELLEKRDVPGVAIAIIQNGIPIWSNGYGFSYKHSDKRVTSDTRFNIGSVSKAITAWAVMKLVERSLIELDAPVDRYLKRWHLPKSDFDNHKVTVRRLLNHTAGLSVYPAGVTVDPAGLYRPGDKLPTLEESLSRSRGSFGVLRVIREPGTRYEYNNGGYAILQLLVEEVTGETFADYMQRAIFSPLRMYNTGYHWSPELQTAVAAPYNEHGEVWPHYLGVEQGSGGVFTTVSDLALFVAAIDSSGVGLPGRGVLKPSTVVEMLAPSKETNGQYGLGYQMAPLKKNGYFIAHQGANEGFRSLFLFDREKRSGIVILTNSDVGTRIVADIVCVWAKSVAIELSNPCPDDL